MCARPYTDLRQTMTPSARDCPTGLDLSLEERWVLHAALLSDVERTVENDDDPARAVSLLARLEDGDAFERDELAFFARVLRDYVDGCAPSRDCRPARSVIGDIETTLA